MFYSISKLSAITTCLIALGLGGCSLFTSPPRKPINAADLPIQEGEPEYQAYCARCHGDVGEGTKRAPALIGAGTLRKTWSAGSRLNLDAGNPTSRADISGAGIQKRGGQHRGTFQTAQDIYNYVRHNMPRPRWFFHAGLEEQEYWALLTYLLRFHAVEVPAEGITTSNAPPGDR